MKLVLEANSIVEMQQQILQHAEFFGLVRPPEAAPMPKLAAAPTPASPDTEDDAMPVEPEIKTPVKKK